MNKELENNLSAIMNGTPQIFLDYDGTLAPIVNDPEKAVMDSEMKNIINSINSCYELFIVTGRALEDIRKLAGNLNIIALHGAIFYINGSTIPVPGLNYYIEKCNKIFENRFEYIEKYKGLRIYNKNGNILFHLGNVLDDIEINSIEKLVNKLAETYSMEVYHGIKIIELRIPGINKGKAIKNVRNNNRPALIAGDDLTDEEAFIENPDAVTIKVGNSDTSAKYNVKFDDIKNILIHLI